LTVRSKESLRRWRGGGGSRAQIARANVLNGNLQEHDLKPITNLRLISCLGQERSLYQDTGSWRRAVYQDTGRWRRAVYQDTGRWRRAVYQDTGRWRRAVYQDTGR
jgi:hypothetical protein